jgi:hypothetical protein
MTEEANLKTIDVVSCTFYMIGGQEDKWSVYDYGGRRMALKLNLDGSFTIEKESGGYYPIERKTYVNCSGAYIEGKRA